MNKHYNKLLILPLIALALTLTSCGTSTLKVDISAYGDAPITIAGLTDEEFTITPDELAKLPLTELSASGDTAKAGTVKGTGVLLSTFVEQYGKAQTDFALVRFIASDAYRVTLHTQSLEKYEILLAVANSNGALAKSEQPLRLVIPGAESNQWIYAVERIEFELLQ